MNRIKFFVYAAFSSSLMFIPGHSRAQGEGTMLLLSIPPSPELNAMGRTGTALPTTDVSGFYSSPAQLGYSGKRTKLVHQFYPKKVDWLPGFNIDQLWFNSSAYNWESICKTISAAFPSAWWSVIFKTPLGGYNY